MKFSFLRINNKRKQLFLAFFLPVLIISISYIFAGIAPFGDRCLMSMDAWGQYFPMLRGLKSGFSEWSFSGGLGFNQIAQSAYYTNSPFWFLLFLVPNHAMIGTVDMLVGLRFGMAGLTFCLWIREKYKDDNLTVIAFSTAYAVSAYTLAFINQFMWMDAVVFLPIVAIGLERLFTKKKPCVYILSLAITIYTNFYIGFMVCIFSVIYFLIMCFRSKISWRKRGNMFLHFSLSSLLSGGLTAIVLIPTYLALGQTIASDLTFGGELRFYHSLGEILVKLLPFSKISLAFEAPNLYCGLITVFLFIAYLFQRNQTIRKRVIFITLFLFALLSFNLNILDFIWHGFHYPNQLPGRESFLAIFLMVSLAYVMFYKVQMNKRILGNCFAILLIIEIAANSIYTISTQTWKTSADRYSMYDIEMEYITENYNSKDEFHRMEFLSPYNHNPGQLYGYNGISYYSSTMSENAYDFFRKIGMEVYAKNVSTKYWPTNILNAIFGIKYLFDFENSYDESMFLKEKERVGKLTVYENPYNLPIAFAVDEAVLEADMNRKRDDELQNEMLNLMLGEKGNLDDINETEFARAIDQLNENTLQITSFSKSEFSGTIDCKKDSVLYTSIPNDGGWSVFVDGKKANVITIFDYLCGVTLTEGVHTIRLVYHTPGLNSGMLLSLISGIIFLIYVWLMKQGASERSR